MSEPFGRTGRTELLEIATRLQAEVAELRALVITTGRQASEHRRLYELSLHELRQARRQIAEMQRERG